MNGLEFINENVSKKMGIAIAGAIMLYKAGAPTWQIMTVICTAVVIQGALDYAKKSKPTKND